MQAERGSKTIKYTFDLEHSPFPVVILSNYSVHHQVQNIRLTAIYAHRKK